MWLPMTHNQISTLKTHLNLHSSDSKTPLQPVIWFAVIITLLSTLILLDPLDGAADHLVTFSLLGLYAWHLRTKYNIPLNITPSDRLLEPYTIGAAIGIALVPVIPLSVGLASTDLAVSQLPFKYILSQSLLMFGLVAPVEEFLYRNIVQEFLYQTATPYTAIVGGFLFFTAAHIPAVVFSSSGFPVIIAGVLTLLYHYKRSIALTIYFHAVLNISVVIGRIFF